MTSRKQLPVLGSPVGRRELLQWAGAVAAFPAASGCYAESGTVVPPPGFLTIDERRALGALANAVLPPDDQPGGGALGVVDYVDGLLSAFDSDPPTIFAGGPFSGRQPFSDGHGAPSANYPPNDFVQFVPLDRVRAAAWRLRLFGSANVPGGGPNDAVVGPTIGLRDQVRDGLAAAMKAAPAPLDTLSPHDLTTVFTGLPKDFQDLLVELVAEGAFSAPEYGGNTNLAGWQMIHFEGDIQPLGYSLYDEASGVYRERPDAPMSSKNPGADPDPMDADTRMLVSVIAQLADGKTFP